MHTADLLRLASQSLLRTKGRAVLTMLGIVIGIASVILMLAIGRAAQFFLLSQISSFGSDLVIVTNGRGDVKRGDPSQLVRQSLTYGDFKRLKQEPWVRLANANLISSDLLSYGGASAFAQVVGSTPDEPLIYNTQVDKGRYLQQEDLDSHARVIVLGAGIAETLFGDQQPIGAQVKINKRNFRVIGVMAHGGTRFFSELDSQVYLPLTALMDLYNRDKMQFIMMKPEGIGVREAVERVRLLYRDTHNLTNPQGILAKDDFRVLTQEDAMRNAATVGTILQILLASIAAISLIVGGIGIMNIMFVTVTERTREIGLRKAVGAKPGDVLGQFLVEAILLTGVGGLVGIATGVGASFLVLRILGSFQEGWKFQMPTDAIALAFGVSALIGIVFGYFPARKAARLNPMEALRYE